MVDKNQVEKIFQNFKLIDNKFKESRLRRWHSCFAIGVLLSLGQLMGYAHPRQSLRPDFAAHLEIRVERSDTGELMPARVYLFKEDKPFRLSPVESHLPLRVDTFYRDQIWHRSEKPKTLEVTAKDESHFILLEGQAMFDLPAADKYRLEIYRGFFYKPVVKEFSLEAEKTLRITASLTPIASSYQQQWLSGDVHIHLLREKEDDNVFLRWLQAEDLSVGNFLELQRQQHAAKQYAYGSEGEARLSNYSIRSGHESRSHFYGHTIFLGPEEMIRPLSVGSELANTPEAYPFPTLLFRKARALGAIRGFAHLELYPDGFPHTTLLMNLARNTIDFVEVFQFGNLALNKWYELLNAGFRVVGLAGSDFPVSLIVSRPLEGGWPRSIPLLGPERSLVKAVSEESAYQAWAAGVRQGDVVLTNGPLLEFSANGNSSGAVLEWSSQSYAVQGTATAVSYRPIEKIEIVINGEVVARKSGDEISTSISLDYDVLIDESSWIAARVKASSNSQEPQIWAHTNPIYLLRDGQPVYIEADRNAIRELWEKESSYYKSPLLVFKKEEQRREFLKLIEETSSILEGPQPSWIRKERLDVK